LKRGEFKQAAGALFPELDKTCRCETLLCRKKEGASPPNTPPQAQKLTYTFNPKFLANLNILYWFFFHSLKLYS